MLSQILRRNYDILSAYFHRNNSGINLLWNPRLLEMQPSNNFHRQNIQTLAVMVWNHTCNFYSKSPWIMQLPNEIQCDLHIPMEKRAKQKQKWNEGKVIEKYFYNKALQKRALWLANMLVPFARRLHADAGALGSFFFFCTRNERCLKVSMLQKKWSACSEQPSSYGARGRLLRTKEV